MSRPRNLNEVLTGVFLILVAICAFVLAWPLSSRTDVGMGPGFLPKTLATVLLAMGAAMAGHGLRWGEPEAPEPWHLRPIVLVLGSVAFFAASIESLGLVVALTGLVLIACAANSEARVGETLALAAGSVVVSALVFVKALGLQLALWPKLPGV
ncbi:MAG TPA: tripartite tricarboxylate transporter TctB family protein [Ramlibacter sp.]|nr:tripartite tricarboxylate transporter TctB family protein [Ramlibacter sp.]